MQYEKELERLNEYQRTAVLDESNACLVNANVGSGKTTVLISKIMYLHYEKQVPYENMVVLTFTNKAAGEIRERLIRLEDQVTEEQMQWFGTFHGVCLSLLKKNLPVERLGYTKDFMVMDPEEELEMAEQLILEHQLKIKYKNRLKKRLEQAMPIKDEDKKISRYQDDVFVLAELLSGEKRRQNKMTYLDLLENACELLKEDGHFAPDWIIVDEVQDSDDIQLKLLDCMKMEHTHLFAVGDPNQVIYSWRGSALNVFYTLRSRYQAKELTLPINYRSSGSILEAARFFLQNGSRLEGVKDTGGKIVVKNHYNPFQEADYLAARMQELHMQGVPYKEMAVFYRLQNQSKIFEDVFTRAGIPYEVSLKKKITDIPVLQWLLRVLRFSVNPADTTSGVFVLSNRDYGFGLAEKDTLKLVREACGECTKMNGECNALCGERAKMNGERNALCGGHTELYGERKLLERMLDFKNACANGLAVQRLMTYFELENYLHPTSAMFLEDKAAVEQLLGVLDDYLLEQQLDLYSGLTQFLNQSALFGMEILKSEIHEEQDSVKLMTLHASKGLEFSHVFITGVNYGLIPLQRSKGMDAEEEERRLFFVGITRAKDYLELSYYTSPGEYRATPGPSRYLSMIPAGLVKDESIQGGPKMDTAERLQEIKRQILASRSEMKYLFPEQEKPEERRQEPDKAVSEEEKKRMVSHKKYGKGVIIYEDADNITVDFADYGEKEFLKMFCELEEIT